MSGVRVGICGILQANKLLKLVARTISRKQRDDVSAQIRAVTRRYLVAPCWKNTRSAGLEVLKGC
jgi:hypothetical protein